MSGVMKFPETALPPIEGSVALKILERFAGCSSPVAKALPTPTLLLS